jgi:hypothetical protein
MLAGPSARRLSSPRSLVWYIVAKKPDLEYIQAFRYYLAGSLTVAGAAGNIMFAVADR